MTLLEKVAYLKGLTEGMKISEKDDNGKIILSIIDLLDDISLSVEDLEDEVAEITEYVTELDEDLGELEEEYYELDDDCDCDCDCDDCEDMIFEAKCPACGEEVCFDEDVLNGGEINCPNCGEKLEFDLDDIDCDCEDGGCDCCEKE